MRSYSKSRHSGLSVPPMLPETDMPIRHLSIQRSISSPQIWCRWKRGAPKSGCRSRSISAKACENTPMVASSGLSALLCRSQSIFDAKPLSGITSKVLGFCHLRPAILAVLLNSIWRSNVSEMKCSREMVVEQFSSAAAKHFVCRWPVWVPAGTMVAGLGSQLVTE